MIQPETQKYRKLNRCKVEQSSTPIKISIIAVLGIILVLFVCSGMAYASDVDYVATEQTHVASQTPTTPQTVTTPQTIILNQTVTTLPTSYDLRDEGRVSPLREQHPYGTCWTFGSLGSVESNLLTRDPVTYAGVDLSQHNLAYFATNRENISNIEQPLEGLEGLRGDLNRHTNQPQSEYLENGGHSILSMYTLMAWIGIVNETNAPYPLLSKTPSADPADPLNRRLNKSETKMLEESTLNIVKQYSLSDDYLHVQNVSLLCMLNSDAVKSLIMKHGAGDISIFVSENAADIKYLPNHTCALYCVDDNFVPNHDLMLIGWDDNYPKENFNRTPAGNGAWLLQNSWGYHKESYYWISYYDSMMNVNEQNVAFFEAERADTYDNNYQYDGGLISEFYSTGANGAFANVFTAESTEYLKAVSVATNESNVCYSIQVYRNPTNVSDPTSGTPMLRTPATGTISYIGYHTIPISSGSGLDGKAISKSLLWQMAKKTGVLDSTSSSHPKLSAGDNFAVVVNLWRNNGNVTLLFERSAENYYLVDDYYSSTTHVDQGESYVMLENGWADVASGVLGDGKTGNARIKAYTCVA